MQTDGTGTSNDWQARSHSSEIIGQFMALAREIGQLKGSQDHHVMVTNQRLTALEQWRSTLSVTPSTISTTSSNGPKNGHGLLSGITHPRRRWKILWILFEKGASVGPTAARILWWLATRAAGVWVMLRGSTTSVWQALEQLWNHMETIFSHLF